jgi:hypothetical protein
MSSGIEYQKKKKRRRRRIKWLIAICWNNHNDDDVKGHARQKYAIVRPYGNNVIEAERKKKKINFTYERVSQNIEIINIGMCNNSLFVWDRI